MRYLRNALLLLSSFPLWGASIYFPSDRLPIAKEIILDEHKAFMADALQILIDQLSQKNCHNQSIGDVSGVSFPLNVSVYAKNGWKWFYGEGFSIIAQSSYRNIHNYYAFITNEAETEILDVRYATYQVERDVVTFQAEGSCFLNKM